MKPQTRPYTIEYNKINANVFQSLLTNSLGSYSLNSDRLSNDHSKFELTENESGNRFIKFIINNKPHNIKLQLDNRSASNKLYITCPYCQKQRQSLYAIKYAYACRACIGLHYASQSERPQDRLLRRIRKMRKELWGSDWPEVNNMCVNIYHWSKPKFMRWNTFNQKRNMITELEKQYWPFVDSQIKKLQALL